MSCNKPRLQILELDEAREYGAGPARCLRIVVSDRQLLRGPGDFGLSKGFPEPACLQNTTPFHTLRFPCRFY
jgi:hypothetical protein